jgi:hypothetical protein
MLMFHGPYPIALEISERVEDGGVICKNQRFELLVSNGWRKLTRNFGFRKLRQSKRVA